MKLEPTIQSNPFTSVAVAFGIGAVFALRPRSAIARALISTAVGTSFAVLRELATDRFASYAKSWIDERARAQPTVS